MTADKGSSTATDTKPVDLLLDHGRIITMDGRRRILRDGAIAVSDGRIVAVGPSRDVAPTVRAADVRDLKGALVHPGFVDGHVHVTIQLVRGVLPDFYDEERMYREYSGPSGAERTEDEEHLSTLLASMEMAHNGTTTFADTGSCHYLDSCVEAVEMVGIRGLVGEPRRDLGDIPGWFRYTESVPSTQECLAGIEDQIRRYPREGRRVWCPVEILGLGTATDGLLTGAKELADRYGAQLIMHKSWSEEEVEASLDATGVRPIEHLSNLGVLGPNVTLVHMIHISDREVDLLAESGTGVVHCPAAGMKRGYGASRLAKFPEMMERGVAVALGCDAANWSDSMDIARMMYLACIVHREVRAEVPVISAEKALEMATIDGARAIGLEEEIGSLERGKRADIVIHNTSAPETHPINDLVNSLVYSMQSETVDTVLVDGNTILQGGKLTNFDSDEAYERIDAAAESLCSRIGFPLPQNWPVF